ncbi:MAG: AAA family ATPase [Spirochaetaceae bacterium]
MNEFKYKKIHILGASGSGTTTLAKSLCSQLKYKHLDSDNYFWKDKYTTPQPRDIRLNNLRSDLIDLDSWILSGAIIDWGNPLIPMFDLVIFLSVPNEIRLERLQSREYNRYGNEVLPNGKRYEDFKKFKEWANSYETGGMEVRSRFQQNRWLEELTCPVLKIEGSSTVEENSLQVLNYLQI